MDPINRTNRPNVPPSGPVGPTQKSHAAGGAFEVGSTSDAEGPNASPGASPGANPGATPGAAGRPTFDRLQARIAESVGQSLPREQVLDRVVTDEVRRTLGPHATPQAVADITDAFRRDPGLAQLFDKLLAKASGNGANGV